MIKTILAILSIGVALSAAALTPQQVVDAFVGNDSMRYATVGVTVLDLEADTLVASNAIDQTMVTASTMKVITSAVALERLGADYRFVTPVYAVGEIDGSHLKGDLVIAGCGDPTMGSRYMKRQQNIVQEVVEGIRALGIDCIEGNIVTPDTTYNWSPYHGDWDVSDLGWDYGAAVHEVNFADNLVTVSFTARSNGSFSKMTLTPPVPGLRIVNRMRVGTVDDVEVGVDYGTSGLVLMGEAKPQRYTITIANPLPGFMLADSIERALRQYDITVNHKDVKLDSKPDQAVVARHESPRLQDIIVSLLDRSDNMFAHSLLRAVGRFDKNTRDGDNLDMRGREVARATLKELGVDVDALFMRDGSGLARRGKATPRVFLQLLKAEADRYYGADSVRLVDVMPRAGKRVSDKMGDTALGKTVALKSGSMSDVQCYVGYYPADKPRYAWTLLVNNWNGTRRNLRNNMGQLLIDLFGDK